MMQFQVDCSHEAFGAVIDALSSLYGNREADETLLAQMACHIAFLERSWMRCKKVEEPHGEEAEVRSVDPSVP